MISNIVAFLCNWSPYAGADLADLKKGPTVKIVRMMCSGRIDPAYVLKSFENGADGVIVGGCQVGDCRYVCGNLQAQQRFENLIKVLDIIGLSNRLRLDLVSTREGQDFSQVLNEFAKKIKELGPSPHSNIGGGD